MEIQQLLDSIKPDLAQVEAEIQSHLSTEIPLLNQVGQYIMASGGKRLRPAIAIFAARMYQGSDGRIHKAAAALEYLHTATLLHDDVVDQADTRRARKAARILYGNPASVLVGDYLLATAFRELTLLGNMKVLDVISQTTSLMAKGEILQLIRRFDTATEADYLAIIIHKTACLFAAAAQIGGALSGAGPADQEALYNYGNDLGIAFQVVDDALDYVEDRSKIGKPLGIDLKERKLTLPLSRLLQVASASDKARVTAMLNQPEVTDDNVHEVVALMQRHDVLPYTISEARRYVERAKGHLAGKPTLKHTEPLAILADFVVERDL
ncbi:MAG TPA: polyprenyl synthetase family protein [bacterium]